LKSSTLVLKQYQVTRKRQITIPKRLADKKGIKPGDTVIFEEAGDSILFKKSRKHHPKYNDSDRVRKAIRLYAEDIPKIKKGIKLAESALIENFSRHLSSK
jgi:AbrB family looped-hinge helix DNA binding protein